MPMPRGSDPKNWLEYQSALCAIETFGPVTPPYSPRLPVEGCSCHFAAMETEAQILYGFLQLRIHEAASDFFFF